MSRRPETYIDGEALLGRGRPPARRGSDDAAAARFMARLQDVSRAEARARLASDAALYRWNAATQGTILRALRARYEAT